MRRPVIELMSQYVDQLVKSVAAIGFYDHVLEDIEKQKAKVLPVYNGFEKLVNDQKHLASLSVQEQQALGQNEVHFKRLLRAMDESASTLIKQKWTNNIRMCLWFLDDVTLTLDDILSGDLEDSGKTVKAREIVPAKRFADADYLHRLSIVQISLSAVRDDILDDDLFEHNHFLKESLHNSLGKVFQLLQRELEDMEANGLPTLHNFPVPDIVVAEIPPSPEDKKEPEADEPTPEELKKSNKPSKKSQLGNPGGPNKGVEKTDDKPAKAEKK